MLNLDEGDVTVTGTFDTDFTITFADTLGNVPELSVASNTLVDGGGAITTTPSTTTEGIGETNLAVTDSAGRVLYVNTTVITSAGVELVEVPGTHDIFNTLITIRDLLKNEKGHTDVQSRAMLNNSFDSLDELTNLLAQTQATVGSRINFLDTLEDNLTNMKYNTEDETTRLEEADIAQLAIELSRREVLYQMSLSVAAKLLSMSLLDFL